MQNFFFTLILLSLLACNTTGKKPGTQADTATKELPGPGISEARNNPKTTPVDHYQEKVANDLNDWYFRVALYETKDRFVYRMVMEYEAIKEEKEISFPNLNMEPTPQIKKGAKPHEAIVGFLDEKGEFREYLKIFVEGGNLQIKTLKHYAVYEKKS